MRLATSKIILEIRKAHKSIDKRIDVQEKKLDKHLDGHAPKGHETCINGLPIIGAKSPL